MYRQAKAAVKHKPDQSTVEVTETAISFVRHSHAGSWRGICAVALLATVLVLSGCGSKSTPATTATSTTTITGSAGDGPVTGGIMTVTDANGKAVVTVPASPKTDDTAHFSFTVPSDTPVPFTVTIASGTDTVTRSAQDFNLIAADATALSAGATVTINVNPLSTLVVASASATGALSAISLKAATGHVLNMLDFGLPAGFDPTSTRVTATNIASVIRANEAVAELIRRTGASTGKTINNTIKAIAEDLTDGVLNGKAAKGSAATQVTASTAGVIMVQQAKIAAAVLANRLEITKGNLDKSGKRIVIVAAADSTARLTVAVKRTQPAATGSEADVSQVEVTRTFIDRTANVIFLANVLANGSQSALNKLKVAVNALNAGKIPTGKQATAIEDALNGADTILNTANANANANQHTVDAMKAADTVAGIVKDTTVPTVTSRHPVSNATKVAVTAAIDVTFSKLMNTSTITTSSFTITPAGGAVLTGTTVNHNGGNNESLSHAPLAYNTVYTVTLAKTITDLAGNALAASSWRFTTAPFTVGGTVSGLATGESVVLQNNAGDDLTVSTNGGYTFAIPIAKGAAYAVTVLTQPAGRFCTVGKGSGTIGSAPVSNVAVICVWLNDTGITAWGGLYDPNNIFSVSNSLTIAQPVYPRQDADMGRDARAAGVISGGLTRVGNGKAGFDFTKLDSAGVPLADQAAVYSTTPWDCVKDNVTGLMWEVKIKAAGLRNDANTYTWYNSDTTTDGGNPGTAKGGVCPDSACDTKGYVAAVNLLSGASRICGFTDWRLPSREELRSIVDYGIYNSIQNVNPPIDTGYFPNTRMNAWYWSASPDATSPAEAWAINFGGGTDAYKAKSTPYEVRLVRGGR